MAFGDEVVVFDELLSLVGVLGEDFADPAEEASGGLHAGACDDRQEYEEFVGAGVRVVPVSSSNSTVEEVGNEVVGGVLLAPGDVLGEHVAVEVAVLVHRERLAGPVPQDSVGLRAHSGLFGVGDTGEHADGAWGSRAEVMYEVEVVAAGRGSRHAAQNARTLFSRLASSSA